MFRCITLCISLLGITSAYANEVSINSMVISGRALELTDNRQVTFKTDGDATAAWISPNGKFVAYTTGSGAKAKLCLIRSSGGPSRVIHQYQEYATGEQNAPQGKEIWASDPEVDMKQIDSIWSPDNAMVALPVVHVTAGPDGDLSEDTNPERSVILLSSTGESRASFTLPDGLTLTGGLQWTANSRKLACVCVDRTTEKAVLAILDMSTLSVQIVRPSDCSYLHLQGWVDDGKTLLCVIEDHGRTRERRLAEVYTDGRPDQVIISEYPRGEESPDGLLQAVTDPNCISIRNSATHDVVSQIKAPGSRFRAWSPDNTMFAFTRREQIADETRSRSKQLSTLWLGSTEQHKLNQMCLALNSDDSQKPTWSSDCSSIAYLCDNRVYISELALRPLTPGEKACAGMPLSQDEAKSVIEKNARQISVAMEQYLMDKGQNGSAGASKDELLPYINGNAFFRPGTQDGIFAASSDPTAESLRRFMVDRLNQMGLQVKVSPDGGVSIALQEQPRYLFDR